MGKLTCFELLPYQGELRTDLVAVCKNKRIQKEKVELRTALLKIQEEHENQQFDRTEDVNKPAKKFDIKVPEDESSSDLSDFELMLDDQPVAPPDNP